MLRGKILATAMVLAILIPFATVWAANGNGPGGPNVSPAPCDDPVLQQGLVLELVATKLGVDLDLLTEAYEEAMIVAGEYAESTLDRPINRDAKLYEYIAQAFDKSVEEVEQAFADAKEELGI